MRITPTLILPTARRHFRKWSGHETIKIATFGLEEEEEEEEE
jgi:hypothetical protein